MSQCAPGHECDECKRLTPFAPIREDDDVVAVRARPVFEAPRKPSLRERVLAMLTAAITVPNGKRTADLPFVPNRSEARKHIKGSSPFMRFVVTPDPVDPKASKRRTTTKGKRVEQRKRTAA